MLQSAPPRSLRRGLRVAVALGALTVPALLGACSSSNDATPPSTAVPGTAGTAPGTTVAISDDERLAQAKTVAVGFFQAQAVNDYDRARERSTDAAALTIDWAEAVNGIEAARDSGYQVPAVTSPNVRVQIDALQPADGDLWTATGFIELSFRPGPVASTTTVPAGAGQTTTAPGSTSTYAVDLTFEGDGDAMRLADYRLDDLPYPVSQLFMAIEAPPAEAGEVKGTTTLGHRDLDGSVQYVVELEASGTVDTSTWTSTFTPATDTSAPGTSILPVGPTSVDGTTFADPLPSGTPASVLVVFPGAFPGGPGTLTLSAAGASPTTTTTTTGASASVLAWALPDFPALTPRPVNTVDVTTSTSTSSTTSTSTTSTTAPSSTTAPTTAVPATTTTRPATTSSSAPTSTATSTTTSTVAP